MTRGQQAVRASLQGAADRAVLQARFAAEVPAALRRWAAARRVVAAELAALRVPAATQLLADDVADLDADRRHALATVATLPTPNLPTVADVQTLGELYPALLAETARKTHGAWFTPMALAIPTAARALEPLAARGALRIVDPAVGAGTFLVAALRQRVAAGQRATTVAERELFGIDLDPTATALAVAAIVDACGGARVDPLAVAENVRTGDGLDHLDDGTFDCVLGNPPWETLQLSRTDRRVDENAALAARRRELRQRFALQGSGKLYTYRLFVERALRLLRAGGRLGLVVPASLWFDRDAGPLRDALLHDNDWEWLFAFENRRRVFAIDGRYRFAAIVARRGGTTTAVRTSFGNLDPAAWAAPSPPHLRYAAADVARLCPASGAFVEVQDGDDLALLQRLTTNGTPLLGESGLCSWRQGDFNMTSDRGLFVRRDDAERRGYVRTPSCTWRRETHELVPLWQGAMLDVLHPNAGAYAGGEGRSTRWRPPTDAAAIEPQYLLPKDIWQPPSPFRVALRALSNATNERTAIACLLADEPCGNSLGVLTLRHRGPTPLRQLAFVAGVLGSMLWDWALRQRLSGTNLNGFLLADTVVPRADAAQQTAIASLALELGAVLPQHATLLRTAAREQIAVRDPGSRPRRQVAAELEVAVARAFGLTARDHDRVLRDCAHPVSSLQDRAFVRRLDPKGFWRIDRELPPRERLPALVRTAWGAPTAAGANCEGSAGAQ